MAARLEALDFAKRKLTPEEKAVRDLVPVLGSRAQMSDLVNGKRGISKTQVKLLAAYFGVSAELFV